MNASNRAEGGTSAFSWVAHLSSRLVVMATTSRHFFGHLVLVPFGEGTMRRTGRGWDPSFFCCFVKSALASAFGAVMLSMDLIPWFDALHPFVGGIPCRLFYAQRNLPICSLVAHLFQEECGGAESHDSIPLGIGTQGFFVEDLRRAVIPSEMCSQGTFRVHSVSSVISHP